MGGPQLDDDVGCVCSEVCHHGADVGLISALVNTTKAEPPFSPKAESYSGSSPVQRRIRGFNPEHLPGPLTGTQRALMNPVRDFGVWGFCPASTHSLHVQLDDNRSRSRTRA